MNQNLFHNLIYSDVSTILINGSIPKIPSFLYLSITKKMVENSKNRLFSNTFISRVTPYKFFYFRAVQYWFKVLNVEPIYLENGVQIVTGEMKPIYTENIEQLNVAISFLSSSLFFLNYIIWSSCQVVNSRDFNVFFDFSLLDQELKNELSNLGNLLQKDYQKNSHINSRHYSKKGREFEMNKQHFFIKKSKPIIDEIDKVLAKHYGFTQEELDFIINYDIKYRMGSELSGDESEEEN